MKAQMAYRRPPHKNEVASPTTTKLYSLQSKGRSRHRLPSRQTPRPPILTFSHSHFELTACSDSAVQVEGGYVVSKGTLGERERFQVRRGSGAYCPASPSLD